MIKLNTKAFLTLGATWLCVTSFTSHAEGFRCGNKLVMEGDTTAEIRLKCGSPLSEEDLGYQKDGDDYVKVTRLVYDLGSGKFLRILEMRNGRLYDVIDGPRR